MKKIFFTLLFLIVLISAYLGFSFYSSVIAKQKLLTLIEQVNVDLSENKHIPPNLSISLNHRELENNLLSSQHRIIVSIVPKSELNLPSNQQNLKRYNLDLTIESGPFPTSNLVQFDFTPLLSKYTLEIPPSVFDRAFLNRPADIARTDPIAVMTFSSSFNRNISVSGNFLPFEYSQPKMPIKFNGGNVNFSISAHDIISNLTMNLEDVDIKLNSPWIPSGHIIDAIVSQSNISPRHHFKFSSFSFKYLANPAHNDFNLGDKELNITNFKFNISKYPILGMDNFELKQNEIQRENITEIENALLLDNLIIYGLNFGSGDLTFISLHRSFQDAINFYTNAFNFIVSEESNRTTINPDPSIDSFLASLESIFRSLEDNPGYQISPLNWRNSQGEITINSEVLFASNLSYNSSNNTTSPYKNINVFHLDIAAAKGVLPQLITHIDQIMGIEESVAMSKNSQLVDNNIGLLVNSGVIMLNDNTVRFTFSYANNSYVLNGIPYSRNQILEFISLVSLRQSGLLSPANLIKLNGYIAEQTRSN
ncbi:DUF945 family protein [Thorsellia anophelis]|uniref:Uncharacterized conserved protein YdgA, DUF945 family n=1 Tax=Thorsellia anophelis DSM 18579 TaxID=1123402 RepID=A0A1H9ZNE5_9GAMM|nr:DUF945 family protein [Thorsellia anophelis]SES83194.1 Uncharacterized conserved protein YdgA, DUF945 family [Thorsellia anophelis DSM 18579]